MSTAFALHVEEIWNIPGRLYPVIWGTLDGANVSVGDDVEVDALDGSVAAGIVEAVELHGVTSEAQGQRVGVMISGPAAEAVRHGSVVRRRT
jgi:hypothetical protein